MTLHQNAGGSGAAGDVTRDGSPLPLPARTGGTPTTIRFNHELLDHRGRAYPVEVEITMDGTIVQTWCEKPITSADRELLEEMARDIIAEDDPAVFAPVEKRRAA